MSKTFENKQQYGTALMDAASFANHNTDGHFTLIKLTTEWRASFLIPSKGEDIEEMFSGNTAEEAVKNALSAWPHLTFTEWMNDNAITIKATMTTGGQGSLTAKH